MFLQTFFPKKTSIAPQKRRTITADSETLICKKQKKSDPNSKPQKTWCLPELTPNMERATQPKMADLSSGSPCGNADRKWRQARRTTHYDSHRGAQEQGFSKMGKVGETRCTYLLTSHFPQIKSPVATLQ